MGFTDTLKFSKNPVIDKLVWTAIEAFCAALLAAGLPLIVGGTVAAWVAVLGSGAVAALSAVITYIKEVAKERLDARALPGPDAE